MKRVQLGDSKSTEVPLGCSEKKKGPAQIDISRKIPHLTRRGHRSWHHIQQYTGSWWKFYQEEALPIGIALPTQSTRMLVAKRTSTLGHVSKCSASYKDLPLALLASPSYFFCAARQHPGQTRERIKALLRKRRKQQTWEACMIILLEKKRPACRCNAK